MSKIIYTQTDEAPMLATYSLLPIIKMFLKPADIEIELQDISLAGRIIANFSSFITRKQRKDNALERMSKMVVSPDANIIKLPNISASLPQLESAIAELQSKGYAIPDYPALPKNKKEQTIKDLYATVLGSAVNPVLREGNSDRRVAVAVKEYARKHPHTMGTWSLSSKTNVASMDEGDFYASEKSLTIDKTTEYKIVLETVDGKKEILKKSSALLKGEIIDAAVMSKDLLKAFYEKSIQKAKSQDILLSLHLKATMMKVSDPIIFGYAVQTYFGVVFEKYKTTFDELQISANNGLGDLYNKISVLDSAKKNEIETLIQKCYESNPQVAMVNSDKGITNLHFPNNVIVDASMPAMIRNSGKMWNKDGELKDTLAMIPDRSYAGIYQQTIDFCKANGSFDPATMGSVSNIGLMAQKSEEYGSHNTTFQIPASGTIKVLDKKNNILLEHEVKQGDIWRMCQTKEEPVNNWIKLAVNRARITAQPTVFWLDENRAHDQQIKQKVEKTLAELDTEELDILILSPIEATKYTLKRLKDGLDTISVTGNVLRDYLTDLFPILELGTSAKMLSIVPLINGGGLFETGAGGSAPKHFEQLLQENHLRWDSLGEFLALAESLQHEHIQHNNARAKILADALSQATAKYLNADKSPSPKVGEMDNRASHFYLALYWAKELAEQAEDIALQKEFTPIYKELAENEIQITTQLSELQGDSIDVGGYFYPDEDKLHKIMQPSRCLNSILEKYS